MIETHRFQTLEEGDLRLPLLLEGDSGRDATRAILVASLNPNAMSMSREWTFEFIPDAELKKPAQWYVWFLALRPETLVLSLAPIAVTFGWLFGWEQEQNTGLDLFSAALATVGILALHASINLFNDYHDYILGWDRVAQRGGSRVISSGWITARETRLAAWTAFALAIALGLGVLVRPLSPSGLIVLPAFLAALGFAIARLGLKYNGYAEITAWFMFGPLLTGGFAWAVSGQLPWQSLMLGTLFGSVALLLIHLKGFERILVDGQAKLRTWPVRAGFDASKKFAYFCMALVLASALGIVGWVDRVPERLLPVIVLSVFVFPLAKRVHSLESPVAGRMRGLHSAGIRLAWINFFAFVVGDIIRYFGSSWFQAGWIQ